MSKHLSIISLGAAALMTFSGCETGGANALAGAATGAALGGIIGGRGHTALQGAAIGAAAGYLVGKVYKHERAARERRAYYEGREEYYDDERGDRGGHYDRLDRSGLPTGRPTDRYGFVTSPYAPHHLIDVRGIPHGAQVVDPSCDQVFINP